MNIADRPTTHASWTISNGHISETGHPIHVGLPLCFERRVFAVGGSNGATTDRIKSKMAAGRHVRFQVDICNRLPI